MNYTTQMNAAKKGIITPEMKIVAAKEKMNIEELKTLIAQGKVVIPANKYHTCINVNGIGSMLKTKINVNLGTSRDWKDLDMELKKANDAANMMYSKGFKNKFIWRYSKIPSQINQRMSRNNWNSANLRCCSLLS